MEQLEQVLDFEEEEILLVEKATKRQEEELLKKQLQENAYHLRKDILKKYFIRMSSISKEKFIKTLLENLGDIDSLTEIAHFMSYGDSKTFVYSSVNPFSKFSYDILLIDHDRMLSKKQLDEALEYDIQWFKTLPSELQEDVIIDLLKRSGGNVHKHLYLPILRKQFHRAILQRKPRTSVGVESVTTNKSLVHTCDSDYTLSDHPSTIEVQNLRKMWAQTVAKYREKVEGSNTIELKSKSKAKITGAHNKKSDKTSKADINSTIDWVKCILLPNLS